MKKLYSTSFEIKSSFIVFIVALSVTPFLAAYLHKNFGVIPGVLCFVAGMSGFVAGMVKHGEYWQAWLERQQRRHAIQLDLEEERGAINLDHSIPIKPEIDAELQIVGPTFDRIQRAIAAFPSRYPEYETKPPKLDDDVRPWLHDSGFVRDGPKGREAAVFGRIISEHFGFSPDTQKS